MTRYVAFMRAINVPGHAKVRMDDLKDAFRRAGCSEVRSYIQSGNVLFDAPSRAMPTFKRVRKELQSLVGEEPIVMFRTLREVQRIVARNPFNERTLDPTLKLYVVFLARKPRQRLQFPISDTGERLEAIGMGNLEVFLVSRRKKSGMYGFPNNFIEREIGAPATSRNWTTLRRIAALAEET